MSEMDNNYVLKRTIKAPFRWFGKFVEFHFRRAYNCEKYWPWQKGWWNDNERFGIKEYLVSTLSVIILMLVTVVITIALMILCVSIDMALHLLGV